jgi:hypothetical protein
LAVSTVHLAAGPNFVLDDWFNLAAGPDPQSLLGVDSSLASSRPGLLVAYGLTFGVLGNHPAGYAVVLAMIGAATALTFHSVLRRVVSRQLARTTAAIWVLVPNHMSLEVWPSTVMISLSLLCVLLGARLALASAPSIWHRAGAIALFAAATLLYEASLPVICVGVVALPWLAEGRVRVGFVAAGWATQAAVLGWIVLHWHPAKSRHGLISFTKLLPAHFGDGVVGSGPVSVVLLIAVVSSVLLIVPRELRHHRSLTLTPPLVAGFIVIVLGTIPFAFYLYAPYGPGDRVLYVTSIGSSLVLGTLATAAVRARRELALFGLLVTLGFVVSYRLDRSQAWNWAGDQGIEILAEIEQRHPTPPPETLVLGPRPVSRSGVTPFLDSSNIQGAIEILYPDSDASAVVVHDDAVFERADPDLRIDLEAIARRS